MAVPAPAPVKAPRRVLVIHTAFPGDLVLSTSFLANLRAMAPAAEVLFLTTPAGAQLLSPNPFSVRPLPYDKRGADSGLGGFVRLARQLRAFAPDLVFCLHRSLRSVLLARIAGGRSYGFREATGAALLGHTVARVPGAFEAEKNHALLEAWAGREARGLSLHPRLGVSEADEREAAGLLAGLSRFAVVAPGSVWATKRWPAPRFGELAWQLWEKFALPTVIVGSRDGADIEAARRVGMGFRERAGGGAPAPLDLTGKTSLGGLKSVLSRATVVIANDSAPLHVAVAMGAPALGIFGPTTRDLGFFPLAPPGKASVAEVLGLPCRPCGLHGHRSCPEGHFRCMLGLEPRAVMREVERLLCP